MMKTKMYSMILNHIILILLIPFSFMTTFKTHAAMNFEKFKAVICEVPDGRYDTAKLSSQTVWSYNTTKTSDTDKCLKSDPAANVTNCKFQLSFCHGYNCSDTDTTLMNTTACISVQEKTKNQTFKLGSYDQNKNQFQSIPGAKGMKFLARFTDGGKYSGTGQNCTLSMDIEFDCNQKQVWQTSKNKEAPISSNVLTSINFNSSACKYTLKFDYSGACPPKIEPGKESENLSFGSVLLIIFFVALAVYFVFGSLVKFCFGNRGKDIIPHSEFWTMLPVYIADGFIFTCTCGRAGGDDGGSSRYDSI